MKEIARGVRQVMAQDGLKVADVAHERVADCIVSSPNGPS
jgi:hypothetical protein